MHPALRTFPNDLRESFVRVLAYLGGLSILSLLCAELLAPPKATLRMGRTPPAEWIEVHRPHAAFSTSFDEIETPARHAIRRHVNGYGRKDIMRFGVAGEDGAVAEIELYRPGAETTGFDAPTAEVARRAAPIEGERFSAAETLDTKFGPVALVDFVAHHGEAPRRCLGFVRGFDDPRLQIAGWFCNAGVEIVERDIVACALDRLTLLSAGSEPKIGALFARAELKRTFCGLKGPILAATPKRALDWIDAAKDPKLRGRLAAQ